MEEYTHENCWEDDSPTARFWRRLIRERAVEFMRDPSFMKKLRYRPVEAKQLQRRFGRVWEEYGTDVYKLIAESHGENWDAEDEEKTASAKLVGGAQKKESALNQREPTKNDDNLVAARKTGSFERVDNVQGVAEESLGVVEEEEEGGRLRKRRESSRARSRSGSSLEFGSWFLHP